MIADFAETEPNVLQNKLQVLNDISNHEVWLIFRYLLTNFSKSASDRGLWEFSVINAVKCNNFRLLLSCEHSGVNGCSLVHRLWWHHRTVGYCWLLITAALWSDITGLFAFESGPKTEKHSCVEYLHLMNFQTKFFFCLLVFYACLFISTTGSDFSQIPFLCFYP
jgi:hypothetical protein